MPNLAALSTGTKVVLAAGVLLLIDTFLAWQEVCVEVVGIEAACATANAWNGFWGVVLGLLTIALLVWVGLQIAGVAVNLNLPEARVTMGLAALTLLFAVIKNLADDHSAWASYVGIVLAAAVAAGAWMRTTEGEAPAAAPPAPTPERAAPPPPPPPAPPPPEGP